MNTLNIILNGKIVKGFEGETILQAAKRNDIEIPTLCNDERLEPFSSCYVCVVEVEGMRGLQPSCSTKIVEGMKIYTDNEKVIKSRKSALELLLSNHYADCVAPCKQTCPAGVDVQGYIALINKGMFRDAVGLIKQTNPLPAICGRVCVRPCEVACRRNLLGEPGVGIDYLKRFATDMDFISNNKYTPEVKSATGKKVAVIGAGPGGLSAAYYLALEGNQADIFEASPHPGGMLRYGIPPYRLPNEIIDKEVESITELGVNVNYNIKLGDNLSYKDLKEKYDSVILAIGSQNGTSIGCENDKAENVFSGIDFLRNMEMTGQKYDFSGKKVAVIGGGNTAMDCCRTAMRCGADKVYVIYRRTEKEMPANPIEIHESKLEGIEYMFLTAPAKVITEEGVLKSLSCFKMELGEPDSSGRRRPVKVDGSEFEIELDIILAAIGQKTDVNFIDDINKYSDEKLVINKWGDIEADKKTLQTSIKSVFACGDGVTGPATLIEAIAQGRKAARSCNQFLNGEIISGEKYEFISKRDNFEKQKNEDYIDKYLPQLREEMPTLDPAKRKNFEEVELGYNLQSAYNETNRCLECGCTEYYTCDLKKYATEYKAEQNVYEGEYKKYDIDFRHPFIEIDNNKCILCSRCIRMCKDVVGANALGLINRGFETYVSPSLSDSLQDTYCESCGMCISTCPTAAMSENYKFKPGPFETGSFNTICNYCSTGCEIKIHHKNGYVVKISGGEGEINRLGSICRLAKFGYQYMNVHNRIIKPLLKVDGKFEEITFEKAFDVIHEKIKNVSADENALFAGARLTNEELYLWQKFMRVAVKTNNVSSFHYLNRDGYRNIWKGNVPFKQIKNAKHIYIIGSEINYENGVVGFIIHNTKVLNNIRVDVITTKEYSSLEHKADEILKIKSYYNFIKSANYYLLMSGKHNSIFIQDNTMGFEEYRKNLMDCNYDELIDKSGVSKEIIENFANKYNENAQSIIVFSEKHISPETAIEIFNLSLITGKTGKTSTGIVTLKEKNNSQGLFDMGINPEFQINGWNIKDKNFNEKLASLWKTQNLSNEINNPYESLKNKKYKNVFIIGEDPIGCAKDKEFMKSILSGIDFKIVQDYFLTDTAKDADLILPASFPFETGGSYSNTQKYILSFAQEAISKIEITNTGQISKLMNKFGINETFKEASEIMNEIISVLKESHHTNGISYNFQISGNTESKRMFDYGCDNVYKRFEEYFANEMMLSKNDIIKLKD